MKNAMKFAHKLSLILVLSCFATGPVSAIDIEWLRFAADGGDVYAQFDLASRYYLGEGLPQNHVEAAKWFRRAALFGTSYSSVAMDKKMKKDYDFSTLLREAESGDFASQYSLGSKYYVGNGVRQDFSLAAKWFRAAAMKGDLPARFNHPYPVVEHLPDAECYRGAGFEPVDQPNPLYPGLPEANLEQLKNAANEGLVEAQFLLGTRYLAGNGVSKNFGQAAAWLRKAAQQVMAWPSHSPLAKAAEPRQLPELHMLADKGDIGARYELANRYHMGSGLNRDFEKAAYWYRETVTAAGFPKRETAFAGRYWRYPVLDPWYQSLPRGSQELYVLGMNHLHGNGVPVNEDEAARCLREVAMANAARFSDTYGPNAYDGKTIDQLKEMSQNGDIGAQYEIGARYLIGKGVPRSKGQAARWFALACEEGRYVRGYPLVDPYVVPISNPELNRFSYNAPIDPFFQDYLDRRVYQGYYPPGWQSGEIPPIRFRYGIDYFDRADFNRADSNRADFNRADNNRADFNRADFDAAGSPAEWRNPALWNRLGNPYLDARDLDEIRKNAEKGDANAQFELGARFYFGNGVPQNKEEAGRWYRMAAMNGHPLARYDLGIMYGKHEDRLALISAAQYGNPDAQYRLGNLHYYGNGVARDFVEAEKWFLRAAEMGNPLAQYQLGLMMASQQKMAEAVHWLSKSARKGNFLAQFALAGILEEGRGVSQDFDDAIRWYQRVAEKGSVLAKGMLAFIFANQSGRQDFPKASRWLALASSDPANHPLDAALVQDEGFGNSAVLKKALAWLGLLLERNPTPAFKPYGEIRNALAAKLNKNEIADAEAIKAQFQANLSSSPPKVSR